MMIPNLPALRPRCRCGLSLTLRTGILTREQAWCGTWYDHPPIPDSMIGHTASVLLQSPALVDFLASQHRTQPRKERRP